MKIVVFDDNRKDRENLVRILNEWGNMTGHQDLILRKFDKITDLENSLNEESFPDLFFLDIMTPERANAGFEPSLGRSACISPLIINRFPVLFAFFSVFC